MHRPRPIRCRQLRVIQILSFQRRVAAADDGLAEVAEAVVYVVVVGVSLGMGRIVLAAVSACMSLGSGRRGVVAMVGF